MKKKENRTKYNVNLDKGDRTIDGITFDSRAESLFYRDFVLPKYQTGEIVEYAMQKDYLLQEGFVHNGSKVLPVKYVSDFYLKYSDGKEVVVDVKGCPDSVAILKRKLFWYKYPDIDYIWMTYSKIDGGWCLYEDVKTNRKLRKKEKELKEKQNGKH